MNKYLSDKKILFALFLVFLAVSVIHFLLFSFRFSDDAYYWIYVADYINGGFSGAYNISFHYLFSPVIPVIAKSISRLFDFNILYGYLVLNIFSFYVSSLVFWSIGKRLVGKNLAALAVLFFLFDYTSQYNVFMVMPDVFTWMFILILIDIGMRIIKAKEIRIIEVFFWGLICGLSILVKTNLAFLAVILFYNLFVKVGKGGYKKIWCFVLAGFLPVMSWYLFLAFKFSVYPWSTLLATSSRFSGFSFKSHTFSFIAAFLYLLPFIVLGIKKTIIKKEYRGFFKNVFLLLLAPIFIWPFVSLRFEYTLFPVIFLIASSGLMRAVNFLGKSKYAKFKIVFVMVLALFLLNTLRVYLTLVANKSHLEFFTHFIDKMV